MQQTTIAVDLAKSVFQVAVSHHTGRVDEEHRLTRARFLRFFAQRPAATVLLEACGSAHHWARTLEQLGHTVQLLPPHETRRYVRRNKTDRADAKALLEAARNEEIHPVPVKSVSQQAVASLHRVRTTWVRTRTARLNTLRGLLREFGVTIPVGARHVVPQVRALVEDAEASVPMALRPSLAALCDEIRTLEQRIHGLERELAALAQQVPHVAHLRTIPGIGLLNATALVACVGGRAAVSVGPTLCQLSGAHAARTLQRESPAAGRYQQTRRPLSPHLAHAWRPGRAVPQRQPAEDHAVPDLGARDCRAPRGEHCHRRDRQPAGPDGVAGVA